MLRSVSSSDLFLTSCSSDSESSSSRSSSPSSSTMQSSKLLLPQEPFRKPKAPSSHPIHLAEIEIQNLVAEIQNPVEVLKKWIGEKFTPDFRQNSVALLLIKTEITEVELAKLEDLYLSLFTDDFLEFEMDQDFILKLIVVEKVKQGPSIEAQIYQFNFDSSGKKSDHLPLVSPKMSIKEAINSIKMIKEINFTTFLEFSTLIRESFSES